MENLSKKQTRLILKGISLLKSEECPGESLLGLYSENRLSSERASRVDEHLKKCLFCLNQMTELKEWVYFEKNTAPLTPDQVKKFSQVLFQKTKPSEQMKPSKESFVLFLSRKLGALFYPPPSWKYILGASFLVIIFSVSSIYLTTKMMRPGLLSSPQAILTADVESGIKQAGVKIDLLDSSGKKIRTIPGIVIDSNGLILTNLNDLTDADSARVNFKDGTSLPVIGVQSDEEKTLAILKVNQNNLVPLKVSNMEGLQIGDEVIHVADPTDPASSAAYMTVTNSLPPKRRFKKERRLIQLAGKRPIDQKGVLINHEGKTIGNVVRSEGPVGYAVLFDLNETFPSSEDFIPVSLVGR
ncbi:MAG: trypsin-like peptidase domain-containing protein [Nitrospiria bacterium]